MASLTGPYYVPAPNPVVPRYGLFTVATGPLDLPIPARRGGIQYETSVCDLPNAYEVNCYEDLSEKTLTNSVEVVTGAPFIVYSAIRCSPVGLANWGTERVQRFLFDQLVAGEQATVEATFSSSAAGQFPGLSGNPNVVNLGTADGVDGGVSKLEGWLYARYGLPGVIHAPAVVGAYFDNPLMGKDSRGVWRTPLTTAISFGNYAGTGPTGQASADGEVWLYITGQVAIWRTPDSELFSPPMGQVLNRGTNVITTVMEREYVVTYDCYAAAVLVALDPPDEVVST